MMLDQDTANENVKKMDELISKLNTAMNDDNYIDINKDTERKHDTSESREAKDKIYKEIAHMLQSIPEDEMKKLVTQHNSLQQMAFDVASYSGNRINHVKEIDTENYNHMKHLATCEASLGSVQSYPEDMESQDQLNSEEWLEVLPSLSEQDTAKTNEELIKETEKVNKEVYIPGQINGYPSKAQVKLSDIPSSILSALTTAKPANITIYRNVEKNYGITVSMPKRKLTVVCSFESSDNLMKVKSVAVDANGYNRVFTASYNNEKMSKNANAKYLFNYVKRLAL